MRIECPVPIALSVLALALALAACGGDAPTAPSVDDGAELTMQRMPGPVDPNAPLPKGHPPVAGIPTGIPSSGEMPAGHPPVEGAAPGGTPAPAGPAPVMWKVPEGWVQTRPTSSMRIAQFVVAEIDGEPLECKIFGGIGGTPEQNVERWVGQFSAGPGGVAAKDAALVTDREVSGLRLKRLAMSGTFGGGMTAGGPGGADETLWRMLAVTVEGAGSPVQILLVGPADVVSEHESRFDALIGSLRAVR